MPEPAPWRFSTRGIAARLFLTCWLIYILHFATNTVREIYPALAIGDHCSFRVDEYANLHPDLFEKPSYGWHINNNPGASMVAAIPYAVFSPLVNRIVARVQQQRAATPDRERQEWTLAVKYVSLRNYTRHNGLRQRAEEGSGFSFQKSKKVAS